MNWAPGPSPREREWRASRSVQLSDHFEAQQDSEFPRRWHSGVSSQVAGVLAHTMRLALDPFRLLLISLAGYLNQQQQDVIDYFQEEKRVLRQQVGNKRLRLNDDQRPGSSGQCQEIGSAGAS